MEWVCFKILWHFTTFYNDYSTVNVFDNAHSICLPSFQKGFPQKKNTERLRTCASSAFDPCSNRNKLYLLQQQNSFSRSFFPQYALLHYTFSVHESSESHKKELQQKRWTFAKMAASLPHLVCAAGPLLPSDAHAEQFERVDGKLHASTAFPSNGAAFVVYLSDVFLQFLFHRYT